MSSVQPVILGGIWECLICERSLCNSEKPSHLSGNPHRKKKAAVEAAARRMKEHEALLQMAEKSVMAEKEQREQQILIAEQDEELVRRIEQSLVAEEERREVEWRREELRRLEQIRIVEEKQVEKELRRAEQSRVDEDRRREKELRWAEQIRTCKEKRRRKELESERTEDKRIAEEKRIEQAVLETAQTGVGAEQMVERGWGRLKDEENAWYFRTAPVIRIRELAEAAGRRNMDRRIKEENRQDRFKRLQTDQLDQGNRAEEQVHKQPIRTELMGAADLTRMEQEREQEDEEEWQNRELPKREERMRAQPGCADLGCRQREENRIPEAEQQNTVANRWVSPRQTTTLIDTNLAEGRGNNRQRAMIIQYPQSQDKLYQGQPQPAREYGAIGKCLVRSRK